METGKNNPKIIKINTKMPKIDEKTQKNAQKLPQIIKNPPTNENFNGFVKLNSVQKSKYVLKYLIQLAKAKLITFEDALEIVKSIAKNE